MSKVISMRLKDTQAVRLERYARSLGKSPAETCSLLIEEHLRQQEFAGIEFRPSPVGRQAYLKGSRLTVWFVVHVSTSCNMDEHQLASHFDKPVDLMTAALNYYEAFRDEIDVAIADYEAVDYDSLKRLLPNLELVQLSKGDDE